MADNETKKIRPDANDPSLALRNEKHMNPKEQRNMDLTSSNHSDMNNSIEGPGMNGPVTDFDASQRPLTVRELLAAIRQPASEPASTRQSHGFNVATTILCTFMILLTTSNQASALTTLNAGDTFSYTTGQAFADSFLLNGGTILPNASSTGGFNANLTGTVSVTATSTIRTGPVTANVSHTATTNQLTLSGNITGSADLVLNTLGSTSTLASPGTDRGRITFSGNNSGYSGDIFLNNGILLATNNNALGTGDIFVTNNLAANGSVLNNGVALEISGNTTIANDITLIGTGVLNAVPTAATTNYRVTIQGTTGTNTLTGNILIGGTSDFVILKPSSSNAANILNINGNVSIAPGGFSPTVPVGAPGGGLMLRGGVTNVINNGFINGNINIGNINLVKTDFGNWTINTTGHTWGTTIINAGTLKNGTHDALDTTAILDINVANANQFGIYDLNGFNQTVAGLTQTTINNNSSRTITNTSATAAVLTIDSAAASFFGGSTITGLASGNVRGAEIVGNLGITKKGVGTLTLIGEQANTFTGALDILEGSVAITASSSIIGARKVQGTPLINIADGASFNVTGVTGGFTLAANKTLAGDGDVIGNFASASLSTISPGGDAIGSLDFANNLDINGVLRLQIDGANGIADQINVAGLLDLTDATIQIEFLSLPTVPFLSFGTFGSVTGVPTITGLTAFPGFSVVFNPTTGQFALVNPSLAVIVPEPASFALLTLGGAALIRRRRRLV